MHGYLRRRTLFAAGAAFAVAASQRAAAQQGFPSRLIRIVHGYDAGSNPDVIARHLAQPLTELLGQQVAVDPKPGAAERVAAAMVARAPADGHTLYLMTGGQAAVSAIDPALPYDALRDFAFISTVTRFPFVLVVAPDSRFTTLADYLAAARREPGKLSYGSSGIGGTLHLTIELLRGQAGVDLLHVPYKGNPAQPLGDLTTGRLDLHVITVTGAQPLLKAGKVRALAVTSKERSSHFPDVPAVAETVPGFDVVSWLGFTAPAGVPAAIIDRLAAAIRTAVDQPAVRQRLEELGNEVYAGTPAAFRERVAADIAKWKPLARILNSQ
ncbi:MAG TPA: tripartite tricarboxylate transporter substrate-binding protein [Vineibacter sp.]|nr:tripartite tricarboxylate transporter substrate-binding protein [Vineibacter sp.]